MELSNENLSRMLAACFDAGIQHGRALGCEIASLSVRASEPLTEAEREEAYAEGHREGLRKAAQLVLNMKNEREVRYRAMPNPQAVNSARTGAERRAEKTRVWASVLWLTRALGVLQAELRRDATEEEVA